MSVSPLAGTPATPAVLIDVAQLVAAYYTNAPDPSIPEQRVAFGTSGHRGSALEKTFNESHVLAISQAICLYRKLHSIDGPLFLGIDTHALSVPAFESALEVLAANGVEVLIAHDGEYTPTPAISHAILVYNRGRKTRLADGIVVTPSHNPPDSGGFKYNPPNGGPADTERHRLDRSQGQRVARIRFEGRAAHAVRSGAALRYDARARFPEHVRRRPRQRNRSRCDQWCPRPHWRGSARRRGRALLGAYCGTLQTRSDRYQRKGRFDFRVHESRLGWTYPHGSVVGVRNAARYCVEGSLRHRACV